MRTHRPTKANSYSQPLHEGARHRPRWRCRSVTREPFAAVVRCRRRRLFGVYAARLGEDFPAVLRRINDYNRAAGSIILRGRSSSIVKSMRGVGLLIVVSIAVAAGLVFGLIPESDLSIASFFFGLGQA